jgi:hypothetical protein
MESSYQKSDCPKQYGPYTGEAIWQAKQKCPHLVSLFPTILSIFVSPKKPGKSMPLHDQIDPWD